MKQREHQSGFSTTVVLLAVLVVAVLAVTGLVVYQRNKPSSTKTSATTSPTQTTAQPQSTATTQTQQTATRYLTIKEWRVKMLLSDTIKDAYYVVGEGSSYGPGGLPSTMWLGLASFNSASCNPSRNDNGERGALGAILRVSPTETDPVSHQLLTHDLPNGATINGWYYAYQSLLKNNPCASESTLQPIDSAFAVAAKGIVAATN